VALDDESDIRAIVFDKKMVFDGEDLLVFEVVLQRGVVELLQQRVEFEGHDANEHILSLVADPEPHRAVNGKLELPRQVRSQASAWERGSDPELGNERNSGCCRHWEPCGPAQKKPAGWRRGLAREG
jgi:hypothetical protein